MAEEAEIILPPDETPESATDGYGRQNTNIFAQRNGIDRTGVLASVSGATLSISGPVDVNGVLYGINAAVSFNLSTAGRYFIYLFDTGSDPASLTPTLTTSSGVFDGSRNARYISGPPGGYRVLNWCLDSDGTNVSVSKLLTPGIEEGGEAANSIPNLNAQPETFVSTSGTWIAPRSKTYTIEMTAPGGSGGAGGTATSGVAGSGGGGGGGSGLFGTKTLFIEAGDSWTATFSATPGANLTFTNGVANLIAQNGSDGATGVAGTSGGSGGAGGPGGNASLGFDFTFLGVGGSPGLPQSTSAGFTVGGNGGIGGQFLGGGGGAGSPDYTVPGGTGSAGSYGGGGGGGGGGRSNGVSGWSAGGPGGTGGPGVIKIIG